MEKFYTLLISLIGTFSMSTIVAQPSLSNQNLASDGDSFTIYTNTNLSSGSNPGNSGANVTWDFSSMGAGTSSALTYSSASSPDYPDANILFSTQGSSNYFDVQNDALTYYGFSTTNASSVFTDGQDQIRVPMSYNDNYTDQFAGTYDAFGQVFDRTGTLDVTADGYGTLSTPQGTYSNVLRIRLIRTSTDEMNGQTLSNNLDTIYFWYNEYTPHPIMTYTINYVDGSEQGRFANYMDDGDVVLSTPEEKINISAYPNPADDIYNIEADRRIESMTIFDMKGRQVLNTLPGNKVFTVDVNQLPRGQYFYELRDQQGVLVSRERLIKQ